MKGKNESKTKKLLINIALVSLAISIAEGFVYYADYNNIFFRMLMILQNSINAFAFKPGIAIKDVMESLDGNSTTFERILGYAYCLSIFAAYYCTLATVYKLLERALRFMFFFKNGRNRQHILIFGYNADVKILLEKGLDGMKTGKKKPVVHVICSEEIDPEDRYQYLKTGYIFHPFDCFTAPEDELQRILKQAHVDRASNVILLDESSVRNFSLLQIFYRSSREMKSRIGKRAKGAPEEQLKVFCRCEDEGVRRMIADLYDRYLEEGEVFDLELISLADMQVRQMFRGHSLHSYYEQKDIPLKDWNTELLIIGFGQVGQQAMLQAMNLGVVSSSNRIRVDVVDFKVGEKAEIFANSFSLDTFDMNETHYHLKDSVADGQMDIFFHSTDVRHKEFRRFLDGMEHTPTYVVVAIDNMDVATHCVMELKQYLADRGESGIPIILRMDGDRRLADYISENQDRAMFRDVCIMEDRNRFLSLAFILDEDTDGLAKDFNYKYSTFRFTEDGGAAEEQPLSKQEAWRQLKLFKRDSSRGLANHEKIKALIYDRLCGAALREKLEEILGTNGTLFLYHGDAWSYNGTEQEFLEKLEQEEFAFEIAKLEHRRWCYFMASKGWRAGKDGKKNEDRLINPCMVTLDKLMEQQPYMVKYDLMPLLAEYVRK